MENRNIYKMDDVLIAASFLMLIPAVYFSWSWLITLPQAGDMSVIILSAPEILGAKLAMVYLYLGGAAAAQFFGRVIRHQEKQALDILDTILYMRNTTVDQLASNLNIPRGKVEKIARKLSRISSLHIEIKGDSVSMGSAMPSYTPTPEVRELQEPQEEWGTTPEEAPRLSRADIETKLRDKSLNFQEKISLIAQLAETQSNGKGEQINKIAPIFKDMGPEGQKKLKRNTILIVILFMTPLWPVALILVALLIIKQAKAQKEGK